MVLTLLPVTASAAVTSVTIGGVDVTEAGHNVTGATWNGTDTLTLAAGTYGTINIDAPVTATGGASSNGIVIAIGNVIINAPTIATGGKNTYTGASGGRGINAPIQIGSTGYGTLDAALAAVNDTTPTTIKLLDNVTHTGNVTIDNGKKITFDLNGKTLDITQTPTPPVSRDTPAVESLSEHD